MSIHLQTNNKNSLRKNFADALNGLKYRSQRSHRLLILSCYVDFVAIRKLIDSVREEVRLTEVRLAFEFFESFRGRQPNETVEELKHLEAWCANREAGFHWAAIRAGALMHAKGYAVVQLVKDEPGDGIVCIGSGNATLPGLGTNLKPNVELSYVSDDDEDVAEFLDIWNQLIRQRRSLDGASWQADAYEFAYSLLASGIFLHDWRNTLRSRIGIIYTLTPEGRRAISLSDELRRLGFDVDQATINRNPLETVDFSFSRILPRGFTTKYTIDTLIGRWCPLSVWNVVEKTVERDEGFQDFLARFRKATEPEELEKAAEQEERIAAWLVDHGYVTEMPDRVARWKAKIETLRNQEDRLARIFLKFTPFHLPYDYSARDEVMELRDSLFETLAMKDKSSFVARKIEEAENSADPSLLDLDDAERADLEELLTSV